MYRALQVQVALTPRLKSERPPRSSPSTLLMFLLHRYPMSKQTATASFRYNADTLRHLLVEAVDEAEAEEVAAEVAAPAEVVAVEARAMERITEVEEGAAGCPRKPSHPS